MTEYTGADIRHTIDSLVVHATEQLTKTGFTADELADYARLLSAYTGFLEHKLELSQWLHSKGEK